MGNVGVYRFYRGELGEAERLFRRALEIARRLKDSRAVVDSVLSLGLIAFAHGDVEGEARQLAEGHRMLHEVGDMRVRAHFLAEVCLCRLRCGNREGAVDALRDGRDCVQEAGSTEVDGWLDYAEGELHRDGQDLERALACAARALEVLERCGARCDAAIVERQLGCLYRDMGPDWVDRAERHFNRSQATFESMGARVELGITLMEIANLWLLLEALEEGGECLERAADLFRQSGALARADEADRERTKRSR
jgi:tetratricopeptide (TPR) repeat protein